MMESRVAMKIPTVVTVRTTHLYSKRNRHTTSSIFPEDQKNWNINSGRKTSNSQPDIPAMIPGHAILEARSRHSLVEIIEDTNIIRKISVRFA